MSDYRYSSYHPRLKKAGPSSWDEDIPGKAATTQVQGALCRARSQASPIYCRGSGPWDTVWPAVLSEGQQAPPSSLPGAPEGGPFGESILRSTYS